MKALVGSMLSILVSSLALAQTVPLSEVEVVAKEKIDANVQVEPLVHVGDMPCELGQTVVLTADAAVPGHYNLRFGKFNYSVLAQATTTGAVRLEDKSAGIVWLQLANKSMLMNQKQGRRLADECKSPLQAQVALELLKNPRPSVLDEPAPSAVVKP